MQDVLLEAKGPGYSSFFEPNGRPKHWFEGSKFKELMEQAKRQAQTARRLGLPVEWHIAEAEVAAALREQFLQAGLDNIRVIHTPMIP